jgi:hypothetical protein
MMPHACRETSKPDKRVCVCANDSWQELVALVDTEPSVCNAGWPSLGDDAPHADVLKRRLLHMVYNTDHMSYKQIESSLASKVACFKLLCYALAQETLTPR